MKFSYFCKSIIIYLIFLLLLGCSSQPEKSIIPKKEKIEVAQLESTKDSKSISHETKQPENFQIVNEKKENQAAVVPSNIDSSITIKYPPVKEEEKSKPKLVIDQIKILAISEPPYISGKSISLKIESLPKEVLLEGLQFKVRVGDDILKKEMNGNYTWIPDKSGQFTIVAKENVSGKEGEITLTVESPAWEAPVIDRTNVPVVSLTAWKSLEGHTETILALAVSPDGKFIATGGKDKKIKIWSIESSQEITDMEGHTGYIKDLSFSPDGKILASSGEDKSIKLWSLPSYKEIKNINPIETSSQVSFSPDGQWLGYSTGYDAVDILSLKNWKEITCGFEGLGNFFDFSPDSKLLAFGSKNSTDKECYIEFVSLETLNTQLCRDVKLAELSQYKKLVTDHQNTIYKLRFNPDGKFLLTGELGEDLIKLWSLQNNREIKSFGKRVSLRFSVVSFKQLVKLIGKLRDAKQNSDSVSLYVKGKLSEKFRQQIDGYEDGTELSKEFLESLVAEFNRLLEIPLYQQETFASITLSEETKRLLSYKDLKKEEQLRLNRSLLEDAYPEEIKKRKTNFVYAIAFSPDGKYFASASSDATIKLWSLETGKERLICSRFVTDFKTTFATSCLSFTPNGEMLISAGSDKLVRIWKIEKMGGKEEEKNLPNLSEKWNKSEPSSGQRYEDKEKGYSFEIPEGWAAQKDMGMMGMTIPGSVAIIPQKLLENPLELMQHPVMILIGIGPKIEKKDLWGHLESVVDIFYQICLDFQEHGMACKKLENIDVGWIMYSGMIPTPAGLGLIKQLNFILLKNDSVVSVVFSSDEAEIFSKYQAIAEKVAYSIRFE